MKITALPRAATLRLERGWLLRFLLPALLALALYLIAFPAGRASGAREDFCRYEPTVTVQIEGRTVAVQVWLGLPTSMRPDVDQAATNASVEAQVGERGTDGKYELTVWAKVVSRSGGRYPVSISLAVPSQKAQSDENPGTAGQPLSNSIRIGPR